MSMNPEDWQRPDVLAMCKECTHFGQCSAILVSVMIIEEGGRCYLRTEESE